MTFDRAFFRKWSCAAALGVVGFIFTTVCGEFLIALLTERGFFAHPSATLVKIGSVFGAILDSAWFHWIGGGIVGFAAAFIVADRMKRVGATEPYESPRWASDTTVKEWRLKVKTLVDFFTTSSEASIPPDLARPFVGALLADTSDIWLDDKLRRARDDFVRIVQKICDRMDDWNKPTWRSDMEHDETMLYLRDAADRLEAGLSGKPVPPAFNPHE